MRFIEGTKFDSVLDLRKVLICDDGCYTNKLLKKYISNIYYELFQPIDESFFKYNYHDQFRDFGISNRDRFKTIKIRRKK